MYQKENRFYFNLETRMCEYITHIKDSTMPSAHTKLRILFDGDGNILPVKVDINNVGKYLFDMNSEPCYSMKLCYNKENELDSVDFYQIIKVDYVEEYLDLYWVLTISKLEFKIAYNAEINLIRSGNEFSLNERFNKDISKENSKVRITPEKLIRNYVLLHMKKQE